MSNRVTIPALQQMKRDGRKIVGVVVYDYQMARVAERAGVDIVSVGDSIGMNLWAQSNEMEVTLDQMLTACHAVRSGVERALVSCDLPLRSLQDGADAAVRAATLLVERGGADMVKLDAASEFPESVSAVVRAGIPVWAQFGVGRGPVVNPAPRAAFPASNAPPALPSPLDQSAWMKDELVAKAKQLEEAGASMLDFTYSGPVAGPAVTNAVAIPVIGGLGGGPWLDGRVRALVAAIGYLASAIDDSTERYANVARIALDAIATYADDVRSGRQIRGR